MHGSNMEDEKIPQIPSLLSARLIPDQFKNAVTPTIYAQSSCYETEKASNILKDDTSIWNAGHLDGWDVPNWCSFDFGQPIRVTQIALRSSGDMLHDPKNINIDTSDNETGPWRTIGTFQGQKGITSWQLFSCSGVSRYFRLNITERHSRYQVYLSGIRFKTSTELGRFEGLSNVEREFLRLSKRKDVYPNEHIGVIQTENVADLGQLTALTFIEWIIDNPSGVIGLPTGKTPELFIKWLRYYKLNWSKDDVQNEFRSFNLLKACDLDEFPQTNQLKFVQLDEFFPISPKQHNSFLGYIRRYYLTTLEIPESNCLLMDFSKLPIFQKHDMHKIFPKDKVDLSVKDRKPRNNAEALQKQALLEVDEFCKNYEVQVRKLGGYGFFLGGIGHDGHIAFNFRGCDPKAGARLVILNYETAAQAAGDFGGITNTRGKAAVTVGLSTITYNKKAKIIIMAAGEKKAARIRDCVMLPQNIQNPASVLHNIAGARVYLTYGASIYLSDRTTEDVRIQCENRTIKKELIYHTVCKLAIKLKKEIRHLTADDFLGNPQCRPIYVYWTKQSKPISELTQQIREFLISIIERGVSLPADIRILHTSPHHDDIMLAYHEIMPFLFKYNQNYFTYVTSGFNSCPDKYITRILRRINLNDPQDIKFYIESLLDDIDDDNDLDFDLDDIDEQKDIQIPTKSDANSTATTSTTSTTDTNASPNQNPNPSTQNPTKAKKKNKKKNKKNKKKKNQMQIIPNTRKMGLTEILELFKRGYNLSRSSLLDQAETLLVLRRFKQVYNIAKSDRFVSILKYHLNEYFPSKLVGGVDNDKVTFLKGLIRESECDRMWSLKDVNPKTNIFHLRSKFYTKKFFTDNPDEQKDAKPMLDLYQQLQPDLITVAFDPEGTGPDTHYKVLQVVAQALRMGRKNKANLRPKIWGYRNVWHRFQICDSSLAIPVSAKAMTEMHRTFLAAFGCQRQAEFPSPEYDGPFSVLSQRFHEQQKKELRILLGSKYFKYHWNEQIKNGDGFILLKEMDVDEFLTHADDLKSRIEIHKQF